MSDYVKQINLLAFAIGDLAHGNADSAARVLTDVLAQLKPQQPSLPGVPAPEPDVKKDEARKQAAQRLFRYWQQKCGHAQAKLTPERVRAVLSRLREGYSEVEIRKAIDGAAVAAYVNDDGHKYDDLTLICRNGSKLESFIERGIKATGDIEVEVSTDGTSVEEQIAALRRQMADLKRQGRASEYEHAAGELQRLMARRGT